MKDIDSIFEQLDLKPKKKVKKKKQIQAQNQNQEEYQNKQYKLQNQQLGQEIQEFYKKKAQILNKKGLFEQEIYKKIDDSQNRVDYFRQLLKSDRLYNDKIDKKNFLIEKYIHKLDLSKNKHKKPSNIRNKLLKEIRFNGLDEKSIKYTFFEPMNALWSQYMIELIINDKNSESVFQKILKADFHGSIIRILNSKIKNQEGIEGIVLRETQNTFQIIDRYNQIKKILKGNIIFMIEVGGKWYKIYGQNLRVRPIMRIKQKFKLKKKIDNFLLNTIEV